MEAGQSIGYATRLAATAERETDANHRPLRRTPDSEGLARLSRACRGAAAASRGSAGDTTGRSAGDHGDTDRRARVRPSGRDRQHRRGTDPAGTAADQPVRIALARPGPGRAEPVELRPGPAGLLARLRRARELRRARPPALSGWHPGDDAGRAGPDRELQPGFRAAHRSPARPVLDPLRQCLRRGDLDFHRGWARDADGAGAGRRRQLWHLECDRQIRRRGAGRQLLGRGQSLRHRRLPRPQRSAARSIQREA